MKKVVQTHIQDSILHTCDTSCFSSLKQVHMRPAFQLTTLPSTIWEDSKMRIASFAALMPLAIMAPKVGPIRFEPSCSESSIPNTTGINKRTRTQKQTTHQS